MTLIFDTSILIELEKNNKRIIANLRSLSRTNPAPAQITFITYYEFIRGIKTRKPKKSAELMQFVQMFNILNTTKKTAEILSDLKIKYDAAGMMISLADLLIASQVIENQGILITLDRDFEKIEELKKILL